MDFGRKKDIVSWAQFRKLRNEQSDLVRFAHSKVPGLESLNSFIRFLVERKFALLVGIAVIVLLIFFWTQIKTITIMVLFIALGAVSMLYNRWIKVSLGVELVMLGLAVTSIMFGRLPGLVVGVLGLFIAEVLAERFTYSTLVSFIGIAVVALIANNVFQMVGQSITAAGIILTVIYDAIIIPGYLLLGSSPGRSALFVVTHLIFNIWAFSFIAPLLFRVLA